MHLDPTLTCDGNAERTSFNPGLFESAEENPALRAAIDFYQHAYAWSNRLIAGDSVPVRAWPARSRWSATDAHAGELPVAYVQFKPDVKVEPAGLVEWIRPRAPERAAVPVNIFPIQPCP